ncbi:unnamed protein product [Protopolystoma xenopodis]|uniref:Uncharacterized protein n=1 Tax=Protopolystoma xenopodis TaxID=117903 RepID=A0A448XDS0_9PLAT|nr:unnamed protein product [Protopolystoma xenopodis]
MPTASQSHSSRRDSNAPLHASPRSAHSGPSDSVAPGLVHRGRVDSNSLLSNSLLNTPTHPILPLQDMCTFVFS